MMDKPMSVDEYLQGLPPEQRAALEILRKQIMEAAPGVVEGIGWGVPQFKVKGKYVAGFAASRKHLTFGPWGGWSSILSEKELEGFEHGTKTIHFTPEKMLQVSLVRKLVIAKIGENEARVKDRK